MKVNFSIPASVYRLQLSSSFNLIQARAILPYLKELGIEGVYCSPCFKATSEHGYDVTDPSSINPALGTIEDFINFCKEIQNLKMLHIMDVIPNHMGIKKGENKWWQDVLENGPYSEFASYFDINWYPEKKELQGRVLLPILGALYGDALESGAISLVLSDGAFTIESSDYILPLAPHSYALILANNLTELQAHYDAENPEWKEYLQLIEHYRAFPLVAKERRSKKEKGRDLFLQLMQKAEPIRTHILKQVECFNAKKTPLQGDDLLDKLLEAQFYRLSYWRVAGHEINYRRFFTVNELVSIRIEDEKVFKDHHHWLFEQIKAGHVQGLRIDHPDGLYDPVTYFERLRKHGPIYTVIEKILERKEKLPEHWNIEGTVGYEYLNLLNGIFIVQSNEERFTALYEEFIEKKWDFDTLLYESKKIFTDHEMASEVATLGLKLDHIAEGNRKYRDFTRFELTEALSAVIASFPVYRSYIDTQGAVSKMDGHFIKVAISKAKAKLPDLDESLFAYIENVLLLNGSTPEEELAFRNFTLHFQQLTGPTMAKGLEDTAFYIYNRLISLNEVGGDPPHFGTALGDFHAFNIEKQKKWPYGFLATSTHDTKRSEDVRARINVLSEIPERWQLEVKKWSLVNQKHKKGAFSLNTEYFIYQTLLGVWPFKTIPTKHAGYEAFCERIWQIILKSMREAKEETSWSHPNLEVEERVHNFFMAILEPSDNNHFLELFQEFYLFIDYCGSLNSLSQVVIKMASPGVVDIYQGNETLTYQLTDPDNRTTVDFEGRQKLLKKIQQEEFSTLFEKKEFSALKLFIQTKMLHFHKEHKELFLEGEYLPLRIEGKYEANIIAFLRTYEEKTLIVLATRFHTSPILDWGDTEIFLPDTIQNLNFQEFFTGKKLKLVENKNTGYSIKVSDFYEFNPVKLFYNF